MVHQASDRDVVAIVLERAGWLREMGLFVERSGVMEKAIVAVAMSIGL